MVNIPLEAVIPGGITGGEQHDQPVSQHKDQRADKAIGKFAAFLFFERDFLKKPANVAKGQIEKLGKRHLRHSPLSDILCHVTYIRPSTTPIMAIRLKKKSILTSSSRASRMHGGSVSCGKCACRGSA